jgi:DNA-binding beta-propeller fold protein YncE
MRRVLIALTLLTVPGLAVRSAPVPKDSPRKTAILVLDDCDEQYDKKEKYEDNLTCIGADGKQRFRVSGFNNCQSIGSSHMIATDLKRKCVWVIENAANRICRYDLDGKETLAIPGVEGSAIAVDPDTGNVWAVVCRVIGQGKVIVFDDKGQEIGSYNVSGWDIVYDPKARAFWVADSKLSKIDPAKKEILFTVPVSTWCASSLDVDARSGCVWVAVRNHPNVHQSANRLLKIGPDGKDVADVDLGEKSPFRVSVDPRSGGVWVAHFNQSAERFSAEGKPELEVKAEAISLQVDPAEGDVWVATPTEVQKLNRRGEVVERVKHARKTTQVWMAALE